MSDKIIDWNAIAVPLDFNKSRKSLGQYSSYKELVAKSQEIMAKSQAAEELKKAKELELKPKLVERLLGKTPIVVYKSFKNPTEVAAGQEEQAEDDDGFYTMVKSTSGRSVQFVETMETIPEGEVLQFKMLEKTLGQLIFKGKSGREYAIYSMPTIMFQGQTIENPGYWGLLLDTDINK